jgi:hypothetical protein
MLPFHPNPWREVTSVAQADADTPRRGRIRWWIPVVLAISQTPGYTATAFNSRDEWANGKVERSNASNTLLER